ncbi:MAG: adenosine-specific kinase [Candidatus Zixiibacteriota bacterium]|nr:adenosine-specific kinase [candidate division Zixibacteria bacterium]MBU1471116.1 adenosine-specific kinase [candidate division Zixibacteria bacterium]
MKTEIVKIVAPSDTNLIFGMTHFIKSVEDIHEVMVNSVPAIKFGVAFSEASQECLVRSSGNDPELIKAAEDNILKIGCGHSFLIFMREAFPINVLNNLKNCVEVCRIFCATANPVEVIVAVSEQGRGVMGVIDGFAPKGVESDKHKQERMGFLRMIGYKLGPSEK